SLYELLISWWRHRVSFAISIGITLLALALYTFTFFGERPVALLQFLQKLEFSTLDTRFRLRPSDMTSADPRIVIVDIDQKSQEVLGKWPFSRSNFAAMLDALHDDGAKVVAFDVTFDKPDRTGDPIRALWARIEEQKKRGEAVDPKLEAQVHDLAVEFDADAKFAKAIANFGPVVLGNFFLTQRDAVGLDKATLDQYADLIEWYALGRTAVAGQTGKEDFANVV